MDTYLVRTNDDYSPLAMFPAPDSLGAALIMRKNFTNKPVHLVNISHLSHEKKQELLLKVLHNCPVANLIHSH